MSKRFLFSMNAGFATQSVLKVLASARMITATSCIVVCTDDELVAALLAKLETSERIETAVESVSATGSIADVHIQFPVATPKVRKSRQPYNGPLVECPKCHKKKAPFHITKTGICKVCHMRELKSAKSQRPEKSQGQWTSAMPQSDGHHQDHLADLQARPKEKINLTKLAGKKIA
jgi:hypothetical protein